MKLPDHRTSQSRTSHNREKEYNGHHLLPKMTVSKLQELGSVIEKVIYRLKDEGRDLTKEPHWQYEKSSN